MKANPDKAKQTFSRWQKRNRDKLNEYQRAWRKKNLDKCRNHEMTKRYGITLDQYNDMLQMQDNTCAVCKQPEITVRRGAVIPLAVDHDHATGKVRALLCRGCNTAIGCAGENPEVLRQLATYVEQHSV